MSAPVQPSDLYFRLQDALGVLRDCQRAVADLGREYALLDAADLAVDTLGDPITAADALAGTQHRITELARTLDAADYAFGDVMGLSSRLLRPNDQT